MTLSVSLCGCAPEQPGSDHGDCLLRIAYDERTYGPPPNREFDAPLARTPIVTKTTRVGQRLDCDGSRLGHITIRHVNGIREADVIQADDGTGNGLYFRVGLTQPPERLRLAVVPVPCIRAGTFEGSLVDASSTSNGSVVVLDVVAGSALPLDAWARLRIDAHIASNFEDVPPRIDVTQAARLRRHVRGAYECQENEFYLKRLTLG